MTNIWRLRSDAAGLTIDAHVKRLIDRLEPAKDALRALAQDRSEVKTRFEVVRYFNADDGEEEVIDVADVLEELAGQHQLLGWALTRDMLEFYGYVGADLWVDDYA